MNDSCAVEAMKVIAFMKEKKISLSALLEIVSSKIKPDSEHIALPSDGVVLIKHIRDMKAYEKEVLQMETKG